MHLRIGRWAINLQKTRVPDIPTLGVTNETDDGWFVLFNDYDDVEYNVVKKDIIHAHRVFRLHNFVVLENEGWAQNNEWGEGVECGSYLLFGLDKLSYWQCREVQSHMRGDYMHRKIAAVYNKRNWVNRIAAKYQNNNGVLSEVRPEPKVKEVLMFKGNCPYKQSQAFIDFFNAWFRLRLPLKGEQDGNIEFIEYSTIRKAPNRVRR